MISDLTTFAWLFIVSLVGFGLAFHLAFGLELRSFSTLAPTLYDLWLSFIFFRHLCTYISCRLSLVEVVTGNEPDDNLLRSLEHRVVAPMLYLLYVTLISILLLVCVICWLTWMTWYRVTQKSALNFFLPSLVSRLSSPRTEPSNCCPEFILHWGGKRSKNFLGPRAGKNFSRTLRQMVMFHTHTGCHNFSAPLFSYQIFTRPSIISLYFCSCQVPYCQSASFAWGWWQQQRQ